MRLPPPSHPNLSSLPLSSITHSPSFHCQIQLLDRFLPSLPILPPISSTPTTSILSYTPLHFLPLSSLHYLSSFPPLSNPVLSSILSFLSCFPSIVPPSHPASRPALHSLPHLPFFQFPVSLSRLPLPSRPTLQSSPACSSLLVLPRPLHLPDTHHAAPLARLSVSRLH